MKLEDQVCSLELAKRLRELGVKQESAFWWSENEHGVENGWKVYFSKENLGTEEWFSPDPAEHIAAFTTAELGAMLPVSTLLLKRAAPGEWPWEAQYPNKKLSTFGKTEADARCRMFIHLVQNGLLKLSKWSS